MEGRERFSGWKCIRREKSWTGDSEDRLAGISRVGWIGETLSEKTFKKNPICITITYVLGRRVDSRRLHHIEKEKPLQIQGLSFLGAGEIPSTRRIPAVLNKRERRSIVPALN